MNAKSYSFKLGSAECTVLLDGASIMGRDRVVHRFNGGTEAEYRQAYADMGQSLEEADISLNVLVCRMGGETVLIDAGEAGRPNGGLLPESMRLAGIKPEEITLVVITHCHGDHVQGLIADDNTPAFPNATYVISKEELDFWSGRIETGIANHGPIVTMMQRQGLRLIGMDEQILPSLTAVPIPGHTPGQIALLFESKNEKLIHMADLLHSPMQFAHPEWSPSFDADTSVSVPTRRAGLGRSADENMLTMFFHLTFPGLGYVKRATKGFTWEPLRTSQ